MRQGPDLCVVSTSEITRTNPQSGNRCGEVSGMHQTEATRGSRAYGPKTSPRCWRSANGVVSERSSAALMPMSSCCCNAIPFSENVSLSCAGFKAWGLGFRA